MGAMHSPLYGNYRNRKFTQIWDNVEDFLDDYNNAGIPAKVDEPYISTLYYLLYARYGNSTVASSDENQFKYKVFSTIYMYGPTWAKRVQMQDEIRALDLSELQKGGDAIYNTALNPTTATPNQQDGSPTILDYINQQNTTHYTKSKIDAYAILANMLETDVTEEFIAQFKKLFLTVVTPEEPLWYVTDTEIVEDDEDAD